MATYRKPVFHCMFAVIKIYAKGGQKGEKEAVWEMGSSVKHPSH